MIPILYFINCPVNNLEIEKTLVHGEGSYITDTSRFAITVNQNISDGSHQDVFL